MPGKNLKYHYAVGVMSGTSLDGLDMALCRFSKNGANWEFEIKGHKTASYPKKLKDSLILAPRLSGFDLTCLHKEYGKFIGGQIKKFMADKVQKEYVVACHGHTVFHQPEKKITLQIGCGAEIAAKTGMTVITNFRDLDVALGGQGAPLVPLGDKVLFGNYNYALNLGGFANISYEFRKKYIAYDICPANIVLNALSAERTMPYDKDGELARSGKLIIELFEQLEALDYYRKKPPKSLGREWVESNVFPLLNNYDSSPEDKLHTFTHHICSQINKCLSKSNNKTILVTGGGALNKFLIETLREHTEQKIIIPDQEIINYKEALIFAFLGVLRSRHEINTLASVTGATFNHSGGSLYMV